MSYLGNISLQSLGPRYPSVVRALRNGAVALPGELAVEAKMLVCLRSGDESCAVKVPLAGDFIFPTAKDRFFC